MTDEHKAKPIRILTDDEIEDLLEPCVCGIPFAKDSEEAREIELFLREADEWRAARKRRREAA